MRRISPRPHWSIIAIIGTLLTGCHTPAPESAVDNPAPSSATATARTGTPTPADRLTALADSITTSPADTTTGPYEYLHTQTWARATTAITRTDTRQWRHHRTGSGFTLTRALPDLHDLTHEPTRAEHRQLTTAAPESTPKLNQPLRSHLPQPLPTDPDVLADALARPVLRGEAEYPRVLASGLLGLTTGQYLTRDERAATLRVLARIPHLGYADNTTDIAGRAGITVTVTADTTTRLTFNPNTGELLAAHEFSTSGYRPGLWSYTLILEHTHTRQPQP